MTQALRHPPALLAVLALAGLAAAPAPSQAESGCTLVAAPAGDDDAEGSEADPFETLDRLVDALGPGDVGCLRAGAYGGRSAYFEAPGAELRSYPGELATITAFVEVKPSAVGAHLHHLRFDASRHDNNTGVKLQADRTRFTDNELTKGGEGICLLAGSYNEAEGIVVERNRIYDCGPPSSKFAHQIYLQSTRNAVVRWNVLSGNAGGWGVHLYTDADGTLIEHNVIDGNHGGVIFAGGYGKTSDRNVVRNNAVTFSEPRWNIEGSWSDGPPGKGNVSHSNCVYSSGEDAPTGIGYERGFTASGNTTIQGSPYVDRRRGDYRFAPGSPCAELVGDVMGAVTGVSSPKAVGRSGTNGPRSLSLRIADRPVGPGGRVRVAGRLATGRTRRTRTVVLQAGGAHGWRRIARARLRPSGRFSVRFRMARVRQARTVRIRAVVPGVARSRPIRLQVRR